MSLPSSASYLDVADGRLYVETSGAGPTVVLIHGFSLDTRMWAPQAPALAPHFRVVRYDLRGFGRSSLPAGPFSHVADLIRLLDHLACDRAHLVGLSLGGGLAVDFALAHPGRVCSLTLVDGTLGGFGWEKDWGAPGRAARAEGVAAARAAWLADEVFAPVLEQPGPAAAFRAMVADYSGWHWDHRSPELPPAGAPAIDRLGEIQAPTLVVMGERDHPDFHRIADRLEYGIPGARRIVLRGVGHLSNLEAPAAFNTALLDFLQSVSCAAPPAKSA